VLVNWTLQPIGKGWDVEPDAVVWVDVALIEASFAQDPDSYLGVAGAGNGQRSRYDRVGSHISSGRAIWMPLVVLGDGHQIHFTDGRHRFAWVRDHAAAALPVATDPGRAGDLAVIFGTTLRECKVVC